MSTETTLNVMVAAIAINSVVSARFDNTKRRIKAAEFGAAYVLTTLVTGLVMLGLWVWLAFTTGHWQFAAIVAAPLLVTIGSLASRPAPTPATEARALSEEGRADG